MDRKEFEHALAELSLPSVLLFEGEEEQLKQEALALLRRSFSGGPCACAVIRTNRLREWGRLGPRVSRNRWSR